nr:CsiV family protein [Marinibactrum halimedae]
MINTSLLSTSLLSTCLLSTSLSWAEDDLYQIEIIAFTQTPSSMDAREVWPNDIALAYPPGTMVLKTAEALEAEAATTDTTMGELSSAIAPSHSEAKSIEGETIEAESTGDETSTLPPAYALLSPDVFTLTNTAAHIRRNNRYRLLAHNAWRQPLTNKSQAASIVVTGGDAFGNHHELEGTITLWASRYVHAKANLWLTEFYPNYGQDQEFSIWPDLPTLPTEQKAPFGNTMMEVSDNKDATLWDQDINRGFNSGFSTFGSLGESGYLVSRVVLMEESRRMRSGEVHYIDHPLFGIVVRVVPVDELDEA